MSTRHRVVRTIEVDVPDYPEARGPLAQYIRGEATHEAYGYARRQWLAWAKTWQGTPRHEGAQRELAWWRQHTKKDREAKS